MIGLEAYRPDLTGYRQCIDVIEDHVKRFTVAELEKLNARERQAGVKAFKWEDFQKTNHVRLFSFSFDKIYHKSLPVAHGLAAENAGRTYPWFQETQAKLLDNNRSRVITDTASRAKVFFKCRHGQLKALRQFPHQHHSLLPTILP